MKSKNDLSISNNETKSTRMGVPEKININDLKSKSNYQKSSKQYNVQLMILEEIKKLKVNLEITDNINKYKIIYFTAISLDELISLNKFFKKFKDYSEAFDYLLKNFTKIDRTKITYLNNNKDIKIILLFSINNLSEINKNDNIIEEGLELILHYYNNNNNINSNRPISNINLVINNLKASLEKNSLSIKEIKNEINNNNKIFMEKENELSKIIMEKFEEFINKINSLDEKNYEIESNFNSKLSELDSKTNICFNELIKKINKKSTTNIFSDNDLKIKLNGIIGKMEEDNENLEKRLENRFNKKFEDFKKEIKEENNNNININENDMINKIKELEEKINNYEKKINEQNENNNLSIKINDLQKIFKENESNINENKLKINELDNKIIELYENINKKNTEEKEININENNNKNDIDNIKNDLNKINKEINDNIYPKIDELQKQIENNSQSNNNIKQKEISIEDNNKLIEEINIIKEENDKKLKDLHQLFEKKIEEINTMINKINENIKEENKEMNNKILLLKIDLLKTIDNKNNLIENKIKSTDVKLISFDNKIINKEENKLKEIDSNKKSYSNLKNKDIENPIKHIDTNDTKIEIKPIKDIYPTRTLTNSNSNGSLIQNSTLHLYKSTLSNKKDSNKIEPNIINNNEDKDKDNKDKKYFYNLSNSIKPNIIKEKNVFDLSIDTNILNNEDITENFFIFAKLKEIFPYKRHIKLGLIYRASRDGDLAKNFHQKCDFIGANITIIKTKEGHIFGGFTIKNWKHLYKDNKKDDPECGTEYKDDKAFGFFINDKKIYENGIPDREIIYCNNNYGPCFKNYFFKIYDECFKNGGICGTIEESNFIGIDKEYEYNGGEKKINVEEIEVFQIGSR